MSKTKAQKYIWTELRQLNEIIDRKIIRGQSYHREAMRHRALLAQMRIMQRESIFSKLMYH